MDPVQRRKIAAALLAGLLLWTAVQIGRILHGRGAPRVEPRLAARSKGDPKARVWVVEYIDFQCSTCAEASKTLEKVLERHPKDLYIQVRLHPLVIAHPFALKSAIYAECAAEQGRFWPFHDLLFETQSEWAQAPMPDDLFHDYARRTGVDPGRLAACVDDPATKARVMAEKDAAIELGVRATPTFFVNGKKVVGPDSLEEELKAHFPGDAIR
jgi:protein-disulfide isomerase